MSFVHPSQESIAASELPALLATIAARNSEATVLRLQLEPPTPTSTAVSSGHRGGVRAHALDIFRGDSEGESDRVRFYLVLGRHGEETRGRAGSLVQSSSAACTPEHGLGSKSSIVTAVYPVVAPVSSLTLEWCARLQRALSILALLTTSEASGGRSTGASRTGETPPRPRHDGTAGITELEVRLAPYLPELHWCSLVDGMLGSHHHVCRRYHCLPLVWLKERAPTRTDCAGGAAAAAAVGMHEDPGDAAFVGASGPPLQKLRTENARFEHTREASHFNDSGPSDLCLDTALPFRVAAVLNGSAPLCDADSTRLQCLVTIEGAPSTATVTWELRALLSHFVSKEVLSRVSLRALGAQSLEVPSSSSPYPSGTMGNTAWDIELDCILRYPSEAAAAVVGVGHGGRVRSIVVVLDLSLPLHQCLLATLAGDTRRPHAAADAPADSQKTAADQLAAAVQRTIDLLVSQNVDDFTFGLEKTRRWAGTAAAASGELVHGPTSRKLTRPTHEVLCHSIAASICTIVTRSPHPAFSKEVERLLWGASKGDGDGVPAAPLDSALSREPNCRATQMEALIEARLRSTFAL